MTEVWAGFNVEKTKKVLLSCTDVSWLFLLSSSCILPVQPPCPFIEQSLINMFFLGASPGLEASCASTINTAKAVVEEAGPAVSQSLHDLASKSVNHSEDSFHKVVTEYGLSLEVPLTTVEADEFGSFPILRMSDWLYFLLMLTFRQGTFSVLMFWFGAGNRVWIQKFGVKVPECFDL